MTLAVQFTDVSRVFGEVKAVDRVSIDIQDGEFFSMLGPSGSGKTTCLRLIAGFEQPSAGSIRIHGEEAVGLAPYQRDVNTVFQDYALFPHMDVRNNVAYGLKVKGVGKAERMARADEALAMVALADYGDRKPAAMSGGQRQRVALARALVNRPRVLLLDEPLGALDLKLREQMQSELKKLQRQLGITFIFVTHDQEEAMSMSDRIAIMLDGHVEQLADPETVYEKPASAFVAGFIGRNNFWRGTATNDGVVADNGSVFVASRPDEQVQIGSSALVAVRPECFVLTAHDPGTSTNTLSGEVASVSHFGDVLQYVVRSGPKEILVLTPRAQAARLAPGDDVWCTWSADDVYCFTDRQADLVLTDPAAEV